MPPVRRGGIYVFAEGSEETAGVLVLTNDRWNEAFDDVGIVPVRVPIGEPLAATPLISRHPLLCAVAGYPVAVERVALGDEIALADAEGLAAVEDVLCHVLRLAELLGPRPAPPLASTSAKCPRWSEIYRIHGMVIGGEAKRYVVVSENRWNEASETAVVVRTTTSMRRHGPEFPLIQEGVAKAACAEATTFRWEDFILDPRQLPRPRLLNLADMQQVARGIVETHALRGAVRRALGPDAPAF